VIGQLRGALARYARRTATPRQHGDWRETVRRRVAVGAIALGLWAGVIHLRLVYLQVVIHGELVAKAERQQQESRATPAKRGDILDRRSRVLATSADADTISAAPSAIDDHAGTIDRLCAALADCTRQERAALLDRFGRQKHFAFVRRRVSPEAAARVAALELEGIGLIKETRRWYPNKTLAAHVLGYVGTENTGLAGIEYAYESKIRGEDGRIFIHTDALNRAFHTRVEQQPTEGATLELTIDQNIQHIAERELQAAIRRHNAESGSVVVMDPKTGEILAMANEPTFNPNAFQDFEPVARVNRAVQYPYEPGSTFKIVTASAAIEESLLPIHALIDTSPGTLRVGDRLITEYRGHNYQLLSFADVLIKSSNVGAVKIGFKIGTERLGRYVDRFGFGRTVGRDFPGESAGIVWKPESWSDSALASVSMGYQISVTPLQVAAAFAAVANGGEYMQPHIVRAMSRDGVRVEVPPTVVRRVVNEDTAATLTGIMEGVVEEGTAKAAQVAGYTIAGKTGTAEKLIGGRYSHLNYASFAGFVPSRNPKLAILVMVDAPRANGTSGGVVAAPVFQRIAEASLRYLGIAPTVNPAPPVLVARPASGDKLAAISTVSGPTVTFVADGPAGTMPDLRGLSARDAVRRLTGLGVSSSVNGDGFVVDQRPLPGTPVTSGDSARLTLKRTPPLRDASGAEQP
jgi:cell division protein FtsI (penicillin-binding protein 3)